MIMETTIITSFWIVSSLYFTESKGCHYLPCLTWTVTDNEFQLTCRVKAALIPVYLFDPFGNAQDFQRKQHNLEINNSYNINSSKSVQYTDSVAFVFFTKNVQKEHLEGTWVCRNGNESTTTSVSLQRGISQTTDVSLCGEFRMLENENVFIMTCFSCMQSVGQTAEFLVNNKTEDSVRFSKGKCFHKNGECNAESCNCTGDGTSFQWVFTDEHDSIAKTFTCEMRFSDELTKKSYRKLAVAVFNGTDFIDKNSHTVLTSGPSEENKPDDSQVPDTQRYWIPIIIVVFFFMLAIILIWAVRRCRKKDSCSKCHITLKWKKKAITETRKESVNTPDFDDQGEGCRESVYTLQSTLPLLENRIKKRDNNKSE